MTSFPFQVKRLTCARRQSSGGDNSRYWRGRKTLFRIFHPRLSWLRSSFLPSAIHYLRNSCSEERCPVDLYQKHNYQQCEDAVQASKRPALNYGLAVSITDKHVVNRAVTFCLNRVFALTRLAALFFCGESRKPSQPVGLEYAFKLPPADDPGWIGADIVHSALSGNRRPPASGRAFYIGDQVG